MHTEYRWILARLEADPAVRVVVVTGTGERFCVGGDSEALAGHVERGAYRDGVPEEVATPGYGVRPEWDHDLVWHFGLRLPVIAAVNGACAGVGLALACVATSGSGRRGRSSPPRRRSSGCRPSTGCRGRSPGSWAPRVPADLLLSGRVVLAEEAERMGLLNGVHPFDELLPTVHAYARHLAVHVSPASLAATKRQLWTDVMSADPGAAVDESNRLLASMVQGPDFAEGVAALRAKRPPRF